MIYNERNKTIKPGKNLNAWGKGNVEILENIGSRYYQRRGDERKKLKRVPRENKKVTRNKTILQELYERCRETCYLVDMFGPSKFML